MKRTTLRIKHLSVVYQAWNYLYPMPTSVLIINMFFLFQGAGDQTMPTSHLMEIFLQHNRLYNNKMGFRWILAVTNDNQGYFTIQTCISFQFDSLCFNTVNSRKLTSLHCWLFHYWSLVSVNLFTDSTLIFEELLCEGQHAMY